MPDRIRKEFGFTDFFQWGFELLVIGGVIFTANLLIDISKTLSEIRVEMAKKDITDISQQKSIDDHEGRIRTLERR